MSAVIDLVPAHSWDDEDIEALARKTDHGGRPLSRGYRELEGALPGNVCWFVNRADRQVTSYSSL
jgi:hypothetical protein